MIPTDTPWSGLEAGRVDTRRVDAAARWNWFWAVMPRADATLVLQLGDLPRPVPDLPRRLPTDFQAKHAIELLAKLRDQGFEGT